MTTQLIAAKSGTITDEMRAAAAHEDLSPEQIMADIASGWTIIPKNRSHDFRPRAIGKGLKTKVNVNIGTSSDHGDLDEELRKLEAAVRKGADSVMDLSTGGDIPGIRRKTVAASPVMLGTVPIYEATRRYGLLTWTPDDLFRVIEEQAEQGVDYMTLHCGVTMESVKRIDAHPRVCGIVSRGGSVHAAWIRLHGKENPLYEQFDRLLEILVRHDVTISLGDGLRPGANWDATDAGQLSELLILGDLQQRALRRGVQTMIEGPGHVPLDEIQANVLLEKKLCHGAPFYTLGPLPTDIAAGYDDIAGCVGGAIAAAAGVDMLCDLTPAEHLRLPTVEDIERGTISTRIAAHIGDLVKNVKGARERDRRMSIARKALDWETMYALALDGETARRMRKESEDYEKEVCTMCGSLCSINIDNMATSFTEEQRAQFLRALEAHKVQNEMRRKEAAAPTL
jgi:phosphomethylpyrimidine synthase